MLIEHCFLKRKNTSQAKVWCYGSILRNSQTLFAEFKRERVDTDDAKNSGRPYLSMRKLYSKWVPCLLTVEQKQHYIDYSERCFELFKRNKQNLLRRHVTMDET